MVILIITEKMFKKIFIILIAVFIFSQYLSVSYGAGSDSSSSDSDSYLNLYGEAVKYIKRAKS